MFRIEMLPAQHGDCLWIEYGDPSNPGRILIDTGPLTAWKPLRKKLEAIPAGHRQIDLVILTHVDGDHIEGAVKLLNVQKLDFNVGDIWFNGWKHLQDSELDQLGPVQGEYISALIQKHGIPWNNAFDSGSIAIHCDGNLPTKIIREGMKITLLSPDHDSLKRLSRNWKQAVSDAGLDLDAPKKALINLGNKRQFAPPDQLGEIRLDIDILAKSEFKSDKSTTNGSSIALLLEFEGKSALFLGDVHAPIIVNSLKRLLAQRRLSKLTVDAVKMPHHASKNNVSRELVELLDARNYLISTNGAQFSHPDPEAIARIIAYGGRRPQLCFNYLSKTTTVWKETAMRDTKRFSTSFATTNNSFIIDI